MNAAVVADTLRRAVQHHQAGRLAEAEAIYREILRHQPDQTDALHLLGRVAYQVGRHQAALELIGRALAINAAIPSYYHDLGLVYQALDRLEDAAGSYRHALALQPALVEVHINLGAVYCLQGRLEDALACFKAALAVNPDHADAYYNLAYTHSLLGDQAAAVVHYQQALALRPDYTDAYNNLAAIFIAQGNWAAAIVNGEKAVALRYDLVQAHNNLGIAYFEQGKYDDAVASYQRALAVKPDYARAHCHLGNAYCKQGRNTEAVASYRRALALEPDYAEACTNLGVALVCLDQSDEAVAYCRRALELKPDYARARHNLAFVLMHMGMADAALACCRQALAFQPDFALAQDTSLLALLYRTAGNPREIIAAHRGYAAQFEAPRRPSWPMHTNSRDPERRLKVGYVSADFRMHSVAYFMEPLLAHHDRDAVEVYGYYNNTREDAVTARLQARVDHWLPCKGMADEELAARIQADGIDILVDLAGHTAGNRLLVFARKPAPVQVTYLGYPATTGLSAIDYRLVTADTDPPEAEAWHSERLYRLPRSLWCYRPPATMPAVIPTTAARRNGFITFGSMNNIAKVSEAAVAAWSSILQAVPGARLVMTSVPAGTVRQHLHERFAAHGIAAGASSSCTASCRRRSTTRC